MKQTFTGDDVRVIRVDANLSQQGFASKFSPPLSQRAISMWETGAQPVPVAKTREIVEVFGLTDERCRTLGIMPPNAETAAPLPETDIRTGADLRAERLRRGLKQREFSKLLRTTANALAQWESRRDQPLPSVALNHLVYLGDNGNIDDAHATPGTDKAEPPKRILTVELDENDETRARIIANIRKLDETQLSAVDAFVLGAVAKIEKQEGGAV